jgi:hypothetical protein
LWRHVQRITECYCRSEYYQHQRDVTAHPPLQAAL